MAISQTRTTGKRAPILAYGCVGAAIAFIFAMTLGVFDGADQPRRLASNNTVAVDSSTP